MSDNQVRVRFAPSPTGGLHLGGMRTVLFNYLFAKHNNGKFILRVEDTDQTRFVPGAEEYIFKCLEWCGISPDESNIHGGEYGPYKQSERKPLYYQYAMQLVNDGKAYIAFDTPGELANMRESLKTADNPSPQYDKRTRMKMRNSLNMDKAEVEDLIAKQTPYVIRLNVPADETVSFQDMIRGDISYDTNLVDDKVLLKADGMPTYHLAVVVDDYLMKITHAFRGEEWLPSAPIHLLLWKYLGWENDMPQWAHLPLILKPDGNGKLSKRDGERLGFPVYAMDWKDPNTGEVVKGFKENGFLPEAFINLLAVLGWNDGTEQEIYTMQELCDKFTIEKVQKGGAKFDYEKAKWFNQQHIQRTVDATLAAQVAPFFAEAGIDADLSTLTQLVAMVKERCQLLSDFVNQGSFLLKDPTTIDIEAIKGKWTEEKTQFFQEWSAQLSDTIPSSADMEQQFGEFASVKGLKKGEVMMPLRVMLVGGKYGPGVFDIVQYIGKEATQRRIAHALSLL